MDTRVVLWLLAVLLAASGPVSAQGPNDTWPWSAFEESEQQSPPAKTVSLEEIRQRVAKQRSKDPLIGIWSGVWCGVSVEAAVVLNDEGSPEMLKAIRLTDEPRWGWRRGETVLYVEPLAQRGTYQGRIKYRNKFQEWWFPTQVVMSNENVVTTYDNVTIQTCGGATHTLLRKDTTRTNRASAVSYGTAFHAVKRGYLVTNYHVVEGARQIRASRGANGCVAQVVASDKANDLTILKIPDACATLLGLSTPFQLSGASRLSAGADVVTYGFPLPGEFAAEPQVSKGIVKSMTGPEGDTRTLTISNSVQPGNSGGPLFGPDGTVVGVVTAAAIIASIPSWISFISGTG